MKTINKILLLVSVLFLAMGNLIAQTVNMGEVMVTNGTIFSTVSDFDNTISGVFINDGDVYVYSNWNNDGMVDFLGNTGLTRYIGNNIQLISGSETSYFYNTLFNNGSEPYAFQLSGTISIGNESSFNTGIVDNDNFGGNFIFEQNARHRLTSNDSHVDGSVIKIGDNSFSYPIGDFGYYRFAEISAPEAGNHIFTGKYFYENTSDKYPVTNTSGNITIVNTEEHWSIDRTNGDSDILVTLSWSEETTASDILVAPFESIHIVRWDEALQLWIDEGGVVNVNDQTVTTAVDDYGIFTLGRVDDSAVPPCSLTVYNLLTPNGDGLNDFFEVRQAVNDTSCAQNMKVTIFNRWGVKVFEENNYDTSNNRFGGYSDGRATFRRGEKLPIGTYFYILTFDFIGNGNVLRQFKKAGNLYINDNQKN